VHFLAVLAVSWIGLRSLGFFLTGFLLVFLHGNADLAGRRPRIREVVGGVPRGGTEGTCRGMPGEVASGEAGAEGENFDSAEEASLADLKAAHVAPAVFRVT